MADSRILMRIQDYEYKESDNPDVIELASKFSEWRNIYVLTFNLRRNLNLELFEKGIRKYLTDNFERDELLNKKFMFAALFVNSYGQFRTDQHMIKTSQNEGQRLLELIYKKLLEMPEIDETNKYVKFARFFVKQSSLRLGGFSILSMFPIE